MASDREVSVLFVCMGNICRSPTAEAVFRRKVQVAGLDDRVEVDSAGTHAYHIGEAPDPRSVRAAAQRGYDMSDLRARKLSPYDAERFDYVLVMDDANLRRTRSEFGSGRDGEGQRAQVQLFLEFVEDAPVTEVPDPYMGGDAGFEHVLDLIEDTADGLLADIRARLDRRAGSAPPVPDGT